MSSHAFIPNTTSIEARDLVQCDDGGWTTLPVAIIGWDIESGSIEPGGYLVEDVTPVTIESLSDNYGFYDRVNERACDERGDCASPLTCPPRIPIIEH